MKSIQEVKQLIELYDRHCSDSQEVIWLLEQDTGVISATRNFGALSGVHSFEGTTSMDQLLESVHTMDRRRVRKALSQVISGTVNQDTISFRMKDPEFQYTVEMTAKVLVSTHDNLFYGTMRLLPSEMGGHLSSMNYRDPLTGAYNRSYFNYHTANRVEAPQGKKCALIYLDIDNFKDINDQFGHHFGDNLLTIFFKRLNEIFQRDTLIARPGGDEALLLVERADVQDYVLCALDQLYSTLNEMLVVQNQSIRLGVSAGVALCPDHGENLDQLMISVDAALRMAKESGKGRYCFYDSTYHDRLSKRLEIYTHLSQAILKDELYLVYQPLYDIEESRIYGAEVLLRWNSSQYGIVPPSMFIPMAEESDLILSIGNWVLKNALWQLKEWLPILPEDFVLSINISPVQIRESSFMNDFMELLNGIGVSPSSVQLELTESVFVDDYQNVKRKLEELRESGVRIALDDFGTGYSSLNYIRNLSLDAIKMDKSFVAEITSSELDRSIASMIVSLAEVLNLKVVAEGIETIEQFEILKGIRCHRVQGYLFGKPQKPEIFIENIWNEDRIKEIGV